MAVDDIVEAWDGIFSHSVQQLHARVREKLASAGIELNSVEGLQEVFQNVPSPFEGLETRYKQEKFYHETLQLVVSTFCTQQGCELYAMYVHAYTVCYDLHCTCMHINSKPILPHVCMCMHMDAHTPSAF